jgi:protein-disulfide isomerase
MAAVCYVLFMICTALKRWNQQPKIQQFATFCLIALSLFGIGSIAWFVILQIAVIKKICLYCMTDHLLGAAAFILTLWALRSQGLKWFKAGIPAGLGLTAFIAIHILCPPMLMDIHGQEPATGKATAPEATTTANLQIGSNAKSRDVSVFNGEIKFDIYKVPVLGNREAPHIMLELFDYSCKHCRLLHEQMEQAVKRYGEDQVCLVVLPAPMNPDCNKHIKNRHPAHRYACAYAQYGLAVNAVDPSKFEAFHNWMMTGEYPPLLSEVRKKGSELVGKEAFDAAVKGQRVTDWISDGVALFNYFGGNSIPKLVTDKRSANIQPTTLQNLIIGLDQMTGLKPKQ